MAKLMSTCELCSSCFFFNEQSTDMPHTTDYLKEQYCMGHRYKECVIYRIAKTYGIDKVPKYLYPTDMFEVMHLNLFAREEGLDMFLKVIYPDGKSGIVNASTIEGLMKAGRIVAFHCSEGWVEARRKLNNENYTGFERRRSNLVTFKRS